MEAVAPHAVQREALVSLQRHVLARAAVVDGLAELRPIALGVSATGLSFFNAGQLRLEASPTRRAMTMAGNRTPTVDKKVASILAEVLTA